MSKTDPQVWGFLSTIMILHWTIKYRVTPVMARSQQHSVIDTNIVHCPLQAQQMSHVSPSETTPTPSQNGNDGGSNAGDEYDADTSGFAVMFQFGWELLSKLRRKNSVYKI